MENTDDDTDRLLLFDINEQQAVHYNDPFHNYNPSNNINHDNHHYHNYHNIHDTHRHNNRNNHYNPNFIDIETPNDFGTATPGRSTLTSDDNPMYVTLNRNPDFDSDMLVPPTTFDPLNNNSNFNNNNSQPRIVPMLHVPPAAYPCTNPAYSNHSSSRILEENTNTNTNANMNVPTPAGGILPNRNDFNSVNYNHPNQHRNNNNNNNSSNNNNNINNLNYSDYDNGTYNQNLITPQMHDQDFMKHTSNSMHKSLSPNKQQYSNRTRTNSTRQSKSKSTSKTPSKRRKSRTKSKGKRRKRTKSKEQHATRGGQLCCLCCCCCRGRSKRCRRCCCCLTWIFIVFIGLVTGYCAYIYFHESSPSYSGPQGILSNYTSKSTKLDTPNWYLDAMNKSQVRGQDGGLGIVLPDGALWVFGDTTPTTRSGQKRKSNTGLRIWVNQSLAMKTQLKESKESKNSNSNFSLLNQVIGAKFDIDENGNARQIIPFENNENQTFVSIWGGAAVYDKNYMTTPYMTYKVSSRQSAAIYNKSGNGISQVAINSFKKHECCRSNFTDLWNMTWMRVYNVYNNTNPMTPDMMIEANVNGSNNITATIIHDNNGKEIVQDPYLYLYYLRHEFLSFSVHLARMNVTDYKKRSYWMEYPKFGAKVHSTNKQITTTTTTNNNNSNSKNNETSNNGSSDNSQTVGNVFKNIVNTIFPKKNKKKPSYENREDYEPDHIEWERCWSDKTDDDNNTLNVCRIDQLTSVLEGENNQVGAQITVAYFEYFERWIMLAVEPFDTKIKLRTAMYPWGQWSKGYDIYNAKLANNSNAYAYCPYLHPELFYNNTIVFTYSMTNEGLDGRIRFVQTSFLPKSKNDSSDYIF